MAIESRAPQSADRAPSTAGAPPRRPRFYWGYYIVAAALVAQFVSVGTQMSIQGPFLKPMTEELGWSRAEFTYAQTFGRFVMAFVGFFIGVYVDRYGGRVMMMIGVTILAAGLFMTSYVTELWQWLLLKGLIFTIGAALLGNLVVNVTMAKWWVEKRGRMIGVAAMGVSLAGIIMPPLAIWLIDGFGWRGAFRIIAIGALFFVLPIAMVMRRQPEDHGLHPDGKSDDEISRGGGEAAARDYANSFTRGEALRSPALYLIVLAFGLGTVGIGAILLHAIPFLTDEGLTPKTAALLSATMSVPALISKPAWGWLMDRTEPKRLAAVGFVMSGVALIIILTAAKAHAMLPLVLGFLLMGWGFGGQIPLQETIWASYFGRRYLGSVRSVAMPFSLVLGAGGPLVISYYFDVMNNYDGAFIGVSVLWFLAAGCVLLVRRPVKRLPVGTEGAPAAPLPAPPFAAPARNGRGRVRLRLRRNGRAGSGGPG
jgi:MFS transporter, OFA family, oxalate/formate antiporter